MEERLKEYGMSGEVSGRVKHLHSIYRKMSEQKVDFENIYDILAFTRNGGERQGLLRGLGHHAFRGSPCPGGSRTS